MRHIAAPILKMLTTDTEFLRAEIMDVLRLFREEEGDFIHTFSREGENYK